jgi:predicted nucleic acid-binding protein
VASVVVDASVVIEMVTAAASKALFDRVGLATELHAPEVIDLEVMHGVRRLIRAGEISEMQALDAMNVYRETPITLHGHRQHLPRIWHLHHNITAYDASYIALAEVLGVPLLTLDAKLARAPGHTARVELID